MVLDQFLVIFDTLVWARALSRDVLQSSLNCFRMWNFELKFVDFLVDLEKSSSFPKRSRIGVGTRVGIPIYFRPVGISRAISELIFLKHCLHDGALFVFTMSITPMLANPRSGALVDVPFLAVLDWNPIPGTLWLCT